MKKFLVVISVLLIGFSSIGWQPLLVSAVGNDVASQIQVVDASIVVKSAAGVVIAPDLNGNYVDVPRDAKLQVRYDFNLLDENPDTLVEYVYQAGDIFQVQLPDELLYVLPGGSKELKVASTSDVLGILTVNSTGLATITFTDYVESHYGMFGWFEIEGTFTESVLELPTTTPIELQFNGEIITIGLVPPDEPNVNVAVVKSGVYNPTTNLITWTVVLTPDGRTSGVTINDTYSSNQVFVDGSMSLDGTAVVPTLNVSTRTLSYLVPYSFATPQTLVYQTTPTSSAFTQETGSTETISFTNTVKLVRNNQEIAQASASIAANWITKTGTRDSQDKKLLHWVVKVNNLKQTLNGVWIEDLLPQGLTPVDGSFYLRLPNNINPIALTQAVSTAPGFYTLTTQLDGKTLIRYDFDQTITDIYQLEFDARVTDLSIYDSNAAVSFTNTATMSWLTNVSGVPSDTASVRAVDSNGIILKTVGNNNQEFDLLNNYLQTWTVELNRNAITISNAKFVDELSTKYEYIADSFRVTTAGVAGTFSYVPAEVGDLTKSGTLEFLFTDPLTKSVTVTFQTKLKDFSSLYTNATVGLANKAYLYGDGIRTGSQSSTATKNVFSQMIAKDIAEDYNYQTRRTMWRFTINRNQLLQNNVVVSDILPVGHRLIAGSLTVDTADAYVFTPTLQPADDLVNADSFTLSFTEPLAHQVIVTFETELREAVFLQSGDKTYTNRVTYSSSEVASLTATVSQTIKNNVVTKSGAYVSGSDYIDWMVTINPNKVELSDIELVDNLQSGLALDVTSVKLYVMELNIDGTLAKNPVAVDPAAYQIDYDATTRVFKFKILGKTNQAYRLEFTTDVTVPSVTVNNTIGLTGSGTTYSAGASQIAVVVLDDDLNAGGGGVNGSISIQKASAQQPDVKLAGAKYALYNSFNLKLAEATTNSEGIATFTGLGLKTYTIVEIVAPEGYHIDATPMRVRLSAGASVVQVNQLDDEIRGSLTISKVLLDVNGNIDQQIKSFKIMVYGPSFPQGQEYTLSNLEPLVIDDLLMGQYRIEELSATAYEVSISEPVTLTFENYDQAMTVTNRLKAPELPYTALNNNVSGYLFGILLILLGALIKLVRVLGSRYIKA